jgi:hypothetical protein
MTIHWTQSFFKSLNSFTFSRNAASICIYWYDMFVYFVTFAVLTALLPKPQFSWGYTLHRWVCSSLLCLKKSAIKHQPHPIVLWFQTSQHHSVSVLNVKAHWISLTIQPLSSRDSVLCWCDKPWAHIAALKTKSCSRSYLTQATDTHPSVAIATVARRPIHGRLVQRSIEPEPDSSAVQLTLVRRWMETQLQLAHKLHHIYHYATVSCLKLNIFCFLLWRDSGNE